MGEPVLIGRREERQQLTALVESARAGKPGIVVIEGEAGVGKSRLAFEAVDTARQLGFTTIIMRAHQGIETAYHPLRPKLFPALIDAADSASLPVDRGDRLRLLAGLGSASGDDGRAEESPDIARSNDLAAASESLLALLSTNPVLVVFDDVGFADEQSLDLLNVALQQVLDDARLGPMPLAAVFTSRTDRDLSLPAQIARLLRDPRCVSWRLADLDRLDAAQLVLQHAAFDTLSSRALDRIMAVTGGNALFLESVAKQLTSTDDLDSSWRPDLPTEISAAVNTELSRLSGETLQALRVASLLDAPVSVDVLSAALGQPDNETATQLGEAVALGILDEDDGFRFAHPLYRSGCFAQLSTIERRRLHVRIADELEGRQPAPDVLSLARHVVAAGGEVSKDRRSRVSLAAAQAAFAVSAWAEAAANYRVALDALSASSTGLDRARVLVAAGRAHNLCGERERAGAYYAEAVTLLEDGVDDRLLSDALVYDAQRWSGSLVGESVDASALLGLASSSNDLDKEHVAALVANASQLQWIAGDVDAAVSTAERGAQLCLEVGDLGSYAIAQISAAVVAWMRLEVQSALSILRVTVQETADSLDPIAKLAPLNRLTTNLIWAGLLEEAALRAEDAIEASTRMNFRTEAGLAMATQGIVAAVRGDFAGLADTTERVTALADVSGYTWANSLINPVVVSAYAIQGEWALVAQTFSEWERTGLRDRPLPPVAELLGLWSQVLQGFSPADDVCDAAAQWILDAEFGLTLVSPCGVVALLAEAMSEPVAQKALDVLTKARETGLRFLPNTFTYVDRARGLLFHRLGRPREAEGALREALAAAEDSEALVEAARAHLDLATVLSNTEPADPAWREHALEARQIFTELRLYPYLERCHALDMSQRAGHAEARASRVGDAYDDVFVVVMDTSASTLLTRELGDTEFRTRGRPLLQESAAIVQSLGGVLIEGTRLGDGIMATFTSASAALACAERCHESADRYRLTVHIGVHFGEVWYESDNIWGDTVNLAARICDEARSGETVVSVAVVDHLPAGEQQFEDLGSVNLRGSDRLIELARVRR